ncbi:MAG: hypothetical protein MZW92_40545 [Comamonadaceae bacterium]|nr:hypothetical protein [Comamonadaceae bacterium]
MPVNLPTHAPRPGLHRPQLPDPRARRAASRYRKGPYFADDGDFSAAGADPTSTTAACSTRRSRSSTVGDYGYRRACSRAASPEVGGGHLLVAAGGHAQRRAVGPARRDCRRWNGLLRYSRGHRGRAASSLTAMAYHGQLELDRPDPASAPSRTGRSRPASATSIAPAAATTHRAASLSRRMAAHDCCRRDARDGYGFDYGLDLFSNFTYFLDDPEQRRPVRAVRRPVRVRRARESREAGEPVRPALACHHRRRPAARRDWPGRALPDGGAGAPLDGPRGHGRADERRGATRRCRRSGPMSCGRR